MNNVWKKNRFLVFARGFIVALCSCSAFFASAQELVPTKQTFNFKEPMCVQVDKVPCCGINSTIFLKDHNQQTFVFKMYRSTENAIHEALGSYIGTSVGIRINKVRIIPAKMPFVGKDATCKYAATLHTCVPGVEIAQIDNMPYSVDIYGGLKSVDNLKSLIHNGDLCDIVALDIFLNNFDRHSGNYLFDQKTDHYYAIDMDHIFYAARTVPNMIDEEACDIPQALAGIFQNNVASNAYWFLKRLTREELSDEEVTALKRVASTLKILLSTYPPQKLFDAWMWQAQQADYIYTDAKKGYIRTMIHYNTYYSHWVVERINSLVG